MALRNDLVFQKHLSGWHSECIDYIEASQVAQRLLEVL
jgi:hypothetical protein